MVRRAFGGKFSDAEIEDIYGNAWVGTLRALRNRPTLSEPELRKYILTAVANHASKELRRRGRRPTAPLDSAPEVVDHQATPDERVAIREQTQVTREILATLPKRRRAVLMFRYAWGLKPEEVCGLVDGLSHRAYRKEITRGVNEVVEKLKLVEQGTWCADREPLIKAYACGVADDDERRQAERHLAHCRPCAQFACELGGRLREIGSAIALTGAASVSEGRASISDRLASAVERVREVMTGARESGEQTVAQVASSGGTRGAGAASAGALAKVGLVGGAPQIAAICLGTGVAATACVAAGVVPGMQLPGSGDKRAVVERGADGRAGGDGAGHLPPPDVLPSQVDGQQSDPPGGGGGPDPEPASEPTAEPFPAPPAEPTPTPQAPAPAQFEPTTPSSAPTSPGASPASGAEGAQEFGP
jgi:DNA-directed RNA polymerase specialized sigma24 family protein